MRFPQVQLFSMLFLALFFRAAQPCCGEPLGLLPDDRPLLPPEAPHLVVLACQFPQYLARAPHSLRSIFFAADLGTGEAFVLDPLGRTGETLWAVRPSGLVVVVYDRPVTAETLTASIMLPLDPSVRAKATLAVTSSSSGKVMTAVFEGTCGRAGESDLQR